MNGVIRCVVLFAMASSLMAQVSTEYLDFGPTGYVMTTTSDASGNLYVVGSAANAGIRAYKLTPAGSIFYSFTFGHPSDVVNAAVVDEAGSLYIGGYTYSPDFPTVHPLLAYTPGGLFVGFLSKIDPGGTQLLFSTLLGGKGGSHPDGPTTNVTGIAIDQARSVYLSGGTNAADFPITPNAFQKSGPVPPALNSGTASAFAMKIRSTLDQIEYSTFLNANNNQGTAAGAIAVDANGLATVTGITRISNFPTTTGAYLTANTCCQFVTRLSADGSSLVWSTLISGPSNIFPLRLALEPSGDVLVIGTTEAAPGFGLNLRLLRLNASGSALMGAAFVKPPEYAGVTGFAFDQQGNIWVSGPTQDQYFTYGGSRIAYQPTPSFFAAISADLSRVLQTVVLPYGAAQSGISVTPSGVLTLIGNGSVLRLPPEFESQPGVWSVSNSAAGGNRDGNVLDHQYVSPGAFISLYGFNLGPVQPLGAAYDRPGHIGTALGGITVSFDGIPASLLYAGSTQINAIVPFGISGSSTLMRVQTGAGFSQEITLPVLPATPYIFHTLQNPSGFSLPQPFAAALNEDGTVNSAVNPAKIGSVVTIFANGAGLYARPLGDGEIAPPELASPLLPIRVYRDVLDPLFGRAPLELLYAGTVPGLVSGVLQVNFRVGNANGLTPGTGNLVLICGDYQSEVVELYLTP